MARDALADLRRVDRQLKANETAQRDALAATGSTLSEVHGIAVVLSAKTDASAPTDVAREAAGLGAWWAQQRGGASDTERSAKGAELAAYLAEDLDPTNIDLDDEDDDDLDDAEIFVEVKTARFLAALDLPVPEPDDLPR